jgi:hypothetical protein
VNGWGSRGTCEWDDRYVSPYLRRSHVRVLADCAWRPRGLHRGGKVSIHASGPDEGLGGRVHGWGSRGTCEWDDRYVSRVELGQCVGQTGAIGWSSLTCPTEGWNVVYVCCDSGKLISSSWGRLPLVWRIEFVVPGRHGKLSRHRL